MQMSLNPKKIEALRYIANGDYRKVGCIRPDFSSQVDELRADGLVTIKYGPGDCARKVLTQRGMCVLASLT